MSETLQVLVVGAVPPKAMPASQPDLRLSTCASLAEAADTLRHVTPDGLLVRADGDGAALLQWAALSQATLDAAVVVVVDRLRAGTSAQLLQHGVQDVLDVGRVDAAELERAMRLAVARKRIERAARKAFATDLATGLPNHAQLREHMTHVLALREREPAPMALIALRIDGLAAAQAEFGPEAANVLRRKVAVRIRTGLRASDVVAAVGTDMFAVLLAWIDAPADAVRVASKIVRAITQPFALGGGVCNVAAAAGLAQYPDHGRDADSLLRRAIAQAAELATVGPRGVGQRFERGPDAAANDEGPPTFT